MCTVYLHVPVCNVSSTIQMLAAIESRLEELFDTVETLPHDMVEAAEKSKEKERRLRQREEKLEEQRLAQEERLRRALERAQADPKKRVSSLRLHCIRYLYALITSHWNVLRS